MTNILILGANGSIARVATELFLEQPDVRLTLYVRSARRLRNSDPGRVRLIEG
jgi:saccharopine dehydrogenase-like NADP-dependent oxidoreductase